MLQIISEVARSLRVINQLTKTSVEATSLETISRESISSGVTVSTVRVVERLKSSSVGKPESTEGTEDDEGERVAEDELQRELAAMRGSTLLDRNYLSKRAQDHEETAKEEVHSGRGSSVTTSASPAHQVARERSERKQESAERPIPRQHGARIYQIRCLVQWSWVTKGLAEISSDLVLWGEIDLLEQLGRDGDAA